MENNQTLNNQIKTLVIEGETEEAIELLLESKTSFTEDIQLLSSRFYKYKNDVQLSYISQDDAKVELTQINRALLRLADKLVESLDNQSDTESDDVLLPKKTNNNNRKIIASIGIITLLILSFVFTKNYLYTTKDNKTWNAIKNSKDVSDYEQYIMTFDKGQYLSDAKKRKKILEKDQKTWEDIGNSKDIRVFKQYLIDFKSGIYVNEANTMIKVLEQEDRDSWQLAENESTVHGYMNYIAKHPEGAFIEEASEKVETLKNYRADKEAWLTVDSINTIESYNSYLTNFENGNFVKTAEQKLKNLTDEKKYWTSIRKKDSSKAYYEYLKKYPNGKYVVEAKRYREERLKRDTEIRNKLADNKAWQEAKRVNTISAYNSYIRLYPRGKYAGEAKRVKRGLEEKLANSKRKIEIRLTKLVCEMSDDEGANNDADMIFFKFEIENASDCNGDKKPLYSTLYEYYGEEVKVQKGKDWNISSNKPIIIEYDNENCDKLYLTIRGKAIENDDSSADEFANQEFIIFNEKPFNDKFRFRLQTSDFTYRCEFLVRKIGW